MKSQLFMVFDVESIGLHGEGFAVGYVVRDQQGEHSCGIYACPPDLATGSSESRQWVAENVPHLTPNCHTPYEMRNAFWKIWMDWKQEGAQLAADVAWPVEARFLAQCIEDDCSREMDGPYPLIDVSSVRIAKGLDPLAEVQRLPNELPTHSPLADAHQSARLLIEALA